MTQFRTRGRGARRKVYPITPRTKRRFYPITPRTERRFKSIKTKEKKVNEMKAEEFAEKLQKAFNPKLFSYPTRSVKVAKIDKARVAAIFFDKREEEVATVYINITDKKTSTLTCLPYNTRIAVKKALERMEE